MHYFKPLLSGIIIFLSSSAYCQTSHLDQSIEKVKMVMENYELCNITVFCFEYSFRFNKETKEMVIQALRYNYQGNPSKKVLTDTRIYKLSVTKINTAMFYPGDEQTFVIVGEIKEDVNGKSEIVDQLILEFNNEFVDNGVAAEFLKEFNKLIYQARL